MDTADQLLRTVLQVATLFSAHAAVKAYLARHRQRQHSKSLRMGNVAVQPSRRVKDQRLEIAAVNMAGVELAPTIAVQAAILLSARALPRDLLFEMLETLSMHDRRYKAVDPISPIRLSRQSPSSSQLYSLL